MCIEIVSDSSPKSAIRKQIIGRYHDPNVHPGHPVDLYYTFHLWDLALCQERPVVAIKGLEILEWNDMRLSWQEPAYSNIQELRVNMYGNHKDLRVATNSSGKTA